MQYIEDVVRARTAETVRRTHPSSLMPQLIAARDHAFRARGRGATLLAEDILFACRHDAQLVARLRLVLSWHPLRRKCRDDGMMYAAGLDAANAGEDGVLDGLANEEVMFSEERDRIKVLEPWALETVFSFGIPNVVDVEADESMVGAVKATSDDRIAADDETRALSRDDYEGWTHARQASFSYRKAKRFRDFVKCVDPAARVSDGAARPRCSICSRRTTSSTRSASSRTTRVGRFARGRWRCAGRTTNARRPRTRRRARRARIGRRSAGASSRRPSRRRRAARSRSWSPTRSSRRPSARRARTPTRSAQRRSCRRGSH